jgi:hypothetical protein
VALSDIEVAILCYLRVESAFYTDNELSW